MRCTQVYQKLVSVWRDANLSKLEGIKQVCQCLYSSTRFRKQRLFVHSATFEY